MPDSEVRLANVASRVVGWWRERQQVVASLADIADHGEAELAPMVRELELKPTDLVALGTEGPGGIRLMQRMAALFGVDLARVDDLAPGAVADMERSCGDCQAKARCLHDLAAGSAQDASRYYCPNRPSFVALGLESRASQAAGRSLGAFVKLPFPPRRSAGET